tara:strand:+ start:10284 stop:10949 length:666 start_codon:yes stop_codon:yes gene_type:complete
MIDNCVYLFDVDNTLLDSDSFLADFHAFLVRQIGESSAADYWLIYDDNRKRLGYSDYLGALQQYRLRNITNRRLFAVSTYLLEYPFAERLYTDAIDVLQRFGEKGPVVIVSDGDAIFQPRKIQRSGLWDAVGGRVLIYINKERMLDDITQQFPAKNYVMVDDKLDILTAMKALLGDEITTVWPLQGHYAHDQLARAGYPNADITINAIGDLLNEKYSYLGV